MMAADPGARERLALLDDLRVQLPGTTGPMRKATERAIARLEDELAGGRDRAARAATGELEKAK